MTLCARAPADVKVAADVVRETPPVKTQVIAAGRNRVDRNKTASIQPVAPAVVSDAAPPPAEQRHFPEGASALGAIAQSSDRQVWWKMPAPTWAPFRDAANQP
jgi:hypothetical protein